ncbi:MAG: hypothetical protein E6Q98_15865 [Rhodospirillaceae bacterium]|nr:MAG: hypothetical protein E6Q98_15865 [Rhodospirillaceae bacterium]
MHRKTLVSLSMAAAFWVAANGALAASASDSAADAAAKQIYDALNPETALSQIIVGELSPATPPPTDPVARLLKATEAGTAQGINEIPGALVCPDFDTTRRVFAWINDAYQERLADAFTGGQSQLLQRPQSGPNLALYGCSIIPAGTAIEIGEGTSGQIPVVRATVDGKLIQGVTLGDMIE